MAQPKALVLTGYGINCDRETAFAFEKAGAKSELIHVNDLIGGHRKLTDYQIMAFPGGFSYGDDTGAGNAFANRVRNHLWDDVMRFSEEDRLAIGICNGFQIMASLGLFPIGNKDYGTKQVALLHNDSARYSDRWVDVEFSDHSFWTKGLESLSLPIAHGEGRFYTDPQTLSNLNESQAHLVAARYINGDICKHQDLEANPNGSLSDIAALSDPTGKFIGMMPHPERAIEFTQLPHWTLLKERFLRNGEKLPTEGSAMGIFRNGVDYFKY